MKTTKKSRGKRQAVVKEKLAKEKKPQNLHSVKNGEETEIGLPLWQIQHQIEDLAVKIGTEMAQLAGTWLELCSLIRKYSWSHGRGNGATGINSKEVTEILKRAGFPDSRISEIKSVSYSTDQIFSAYKERFIGFRAALECSRSKNPVTLDKKFLARSRAWANFERLSKKGYLASEGIETKQHIMVTWTKEDVGKTIEVGQYMAKIIEQ